VAEKEDEKLILLRFHAIGSLGKEGRIQIDLDPPPVPAISEDLKNGIPEWAERDADRILLILNGYLPGATSSVLIHRLLHKIPSSMLIEELEHRLGREI